MAHGRTEILDRWPALEGAGEPSEWDAAIADAEARVSASVWGGDYDLGVIHLAAHLLFLGHPSLVSPGLVQSESVGPISRTYAVSAPATGAADLERTPAGRRFKALRESMGLGFMVV